MDSRAVAPGVAFDVRDAATWPELLSPQQVACVLAVHPNVVRGWLRQGSLPGRKIGRQWRVRRSDVLRGDLLSPQQVACVLDIHPSVVRRWLRQGDLPGVKVGRQWRIRRADVLRTEGG